MGLFSSKKTVTVSSVVYSIAGPIVDRKSYLKTSVIGEVFGGSSKSFLGEKIIQKQLDGPFRNKRSFFRWAEKNYSDGYLRATTNTNASVPASMVERAIPYEFGKEINVQAAQIDNGDYIYWVEKYLIENKPERFNQNWEADIDTTTNVVTISYPDGETEQKTFDDFDPNGEYIFAYYSIASPYLAGGVVPGILVMQDPVRPDTSTFELLREYSYNDLIQFNDTVSIVTRIGSTVTGSTSNNFPRLEPFNRYEAYFNKNELFKEIEPVHVTQNITNMWIKSRPVIEKDVITTSTLLSDGETIQTTVSVVHSVVEKWDHRTDVNSDITVASNKEIPKVFIYKFGSGNKALDSLQSEQLNKIDYFPVIPLRINNVSINHPNYAEQKKAWKKAFKKSLGSDIDSMVEQIELNDSIAEIDYAYFLEGVSVNTQDKSGKKYVYAFLDNLAKTQGTNASRLFGWINNANQEYDSFLARLRDWEQSQINEGPLYGTERPKIISRTVPETKAIRVKSLSTGALIIDFRLSWKAIERDTGLGLGKADAKKGDIWWEVMSDISSISDISIYSIQNTPLSNAFQEISHVRIYKQDELGFYTFINIYGMQHENRVYQNKSVVTLLKDAVVDAEDSSFIFLLNMETLDQMSIVDKNELALVSGIILFNTYQVHVQKWYQSGLFKLFVIIVVAIYLGPQAAGLLGTNLSVGVAIGLVGTAAIIAGAIINAFAAMILFQVLERGATELFGDELGTIIATIAMVLALNYTGGYHSSGEWSLNIADMMTADNLLALTDAVAGSVASWANGEMGDLAQQQQAMLNEYNQKSEEIEQKTMDLFGYGGALLNPMGLVGNQNNNNSFGESREQFLSRTLMTGGDIAGISMSMIGSFSEITLKLPSNV